MGLGAAGVLLLGFALTVPGAVIEAALLGTSDARLAWGPALFRALAGLHGLALLAAAVWLASGRGARGADGSPTPPSAPSSPQPAAPLVRVGLGLLCGIALALRLWRLDTGLWLDEVFTLVDLVRLPLSEIVARFPTQNQHMLFTILAKLSVSAFGESAGTLRLPAALMGAATVWALFHLGRRVSGTREAFLASGLLTFSYHHVWFSQNARGYSGLLLFAVASTWLWLAARAEGGARRWSWYAASLVLGIWTHLTMVFVVAAHGMVYLAELVTERRRGRVPARPWWQPLPAWLAAGSVTLQLYALSLPEFLRTALGEESLPSEWTRLSWVLRETLAALRGAGLGLIVVAAGLAVLGVGWLDLARRDWRPALVFLLPGLLGGGLMVATGHNLWPRFFFFCMGFVLLVAVRGLVELPRRLLGGSSQPALRALARHGGTALAVLAIAGSAWTLPRAYALPKQDFGGARDLVGSRRGAGDAAVAVGLAGEVFARYYAPDWPQIETAEQLAALRRRHETVWLVYTLPIHMSVWHPDLWEVIERDFETVQVLPGTLGDGQVTVCRAGPAP